MTDDSSILIQDTNDKNGEMGIGGGGQGYSTLISDWELDSRGGYDGSGPAYASGSKCRLIPGRAQSEGASGDLRGAKSCNRA